MFKNRVVIITGGSGGIGRALTEAFLNDEAKVLLVARGKMEIDKVLKEFKNREIFGIIADVSKASDVNKIVKRTLDKYARIDVLVNCAAIQKPIGPFVDNLIMDWEYNLKVNLLGTVMMCHEVLPLMMEQKSGSIVNFSGGGSTSSRPNFSSYAVSKTGVVRFTEVVAQEVKKYGVRVNAVSPGAVNTFMTEEVLQAGKLAGKRELEDVKKRLKEGGVSPNLVSELVLFLASNKSRPLTGRLISAIWDDWRNWQKKDIENIMKGEQYTLRRIK